MTPPEFLRSIYGAMLECGICMREIDRTEFGLYMRITRERARRRAERDDGGNDPAGAKPGAVLLRRGTVDELW